MDAHREVPRELVALGDVADAGGRVRGRHRAGAPRDEPEDGAQERRLPGAVGADEDDELAGSDGQVDVAQDGTAAEVNGEVRRRS